MNGHTTIRRFLVLGMTAYGASGCVSNQANAPEFVEQVGVEGEEEAVQTVREDVVVPDPAATVTTEEGTILRITDCQPLAEVDRPTGPSVEIGVTAPLAQGARDVLGEGVSPYTRYNCH